jgi:CheY-like chemotaxis protein
MDIQMPVLDGVEATQEILEYEEDNNVEHTPIIALTANALKGDRERFMGAGMDEYTTKPLVRTEIISLLNHFIGHKITDAKAVDNTPVEEVAAKTEEPKPKVQESADFDMSLDDLDFNAELSLDETSLEVEEELPPIVDIPEEVTAPSLEIDDDIYSDELDEIPSASQYDADILLAKKSSFENRLFKSLLDDLGYTSVLVDGIDALDDALENKKFKLVLFDKETEGVSVEDISEKIKKNDLDTALVMMIDPAFDAEDKDANYVHEIIKNVVNKDLLRLVFEKFI